MAILPGVKHTSIPDTGRVKISSRKLSISYNYSNGEYDEKRFLETESF
jgi:hypothetical protein